VEAEHWRPIVGYEGRYEVSDLGAVRSLPRLVRSGSGGLKPIPGTVMKPAIGKWGHLSVDLYKGGKKTRRVFRVHRLVLEAFVGPCPEGMEVCHNDGIASNNRVGNLRYDTRSGNKLDRVRHGTDHNARKTECIQGHPFDAENTYIRPEGGRACKKCRKARYDKWLAKQGKRVA